MDNSFKLIFFLLLTFTGNCFAVGYDLDSRFLARNLAALRKAELSSQLAAVADVQFQAKTTAGGTVYANRSVPITKKAMGGILKRVALGPWGFALSAGLVALDYYLDTDTQEITSSPIEGAVGSAACFRGNTSRGTLTANDCAAAVNGSCLTSTGIWTPEASRWTCRMPGDAVGTVRARWNGVPDTLHFKSESGTSQTDEQISDALTPTLTETVLQDILTDQLSGLPDSNVESIPQPVNIATADTNPFQHEADQITNTYNNDITTYGDTTNPTTLNNSYTNVPNNTSIIVDVDIPDPCEENPDRVGCSEFGTALPAVPIPTHTPDFQYNPISLTGAATCPSPPIAVTSRGTFTLDNSLLCEFANRINIVIVSICSLLSLYILVGGIRNV